MSTLDRHEHPEPPESCKHLSDPAVCDGCLYEKQKKYAQIEAERDRYKAALEKIRDEVERCIWDAGYPRNGMIRLVNDIYDRIKALEGGK